MGVLEDDKVCDAYTYREKMHDDIETTFFWTGVKFLNYILSPLFLSL